MSNNEYESFSEQILGAYRSDESPDHSLVLADFFLEHGDLKLAATALDRAFGLAPSDDTIAARRREVLDQLEVIDRGLRFRYIPAGSFLMGSTGGDHDERPVHPVRLAGYWMAEVPTTWSAFSDLADWTPPPDSTPRGRRQEETYGAYAGGDLRLQYSRTWNHEEGRRRMEDPQLAGEFEQRFQHARSTVDEGLFLNRSLEYDVKPMVAVAAEDAAEMCAAISTRRIQYRLPGEAEWEKAARGGLIGKKYPWGDAAPSPDLCDFNRFGATEIASPKTTRPNGYGLYGMCGCVWEWTNDDYDSRAYADQQDSTSQHQQEDQGLLGRLATRAISLVKSRPGRERVLRGGSWVDCAEAITVSFRMSRDSVGWKSKEYARRTHLTPTIGFRICRVEMEDRKE